MSRHWNPQEELKHLERAAPRKVWPSGATPGLLMVAAACLAAGLVLYKVAGPNDIIAEGSGE